MFPRSDQAIGHSRLRTSIYRKQCAIADRTGVEARTALRRNRLQLLSEIKLKTESRSRGSCEAPCRTLPLRSQWRCKVKHNQIAERNANAIPENGTIAWNRPRHGDYHVFFAAQERFRGFSRSNRYGGTSKRWGWGGAVTASGQGRKIEIPMQRALSLWTIKN